MNTENLFKISFSEIKSNQQLEIIGIGKDKLSSEKLGTLFSIINYRYENMLLMLISKRADCSYLRQSGKRNTCKRSCWQDLGNGGRGKELKEQWKPVKGFEELYEVSNYGNVQSLPRQAGKVRIKGRTLKPFKNRNGYYCVCLSREGMSKTVGVHRLVATAFVPNPDGKETVNHINEDKSDNRAVNLEWLTLRENLHYGTRAERQHIRT